MKKIFFILCFLLITQTTQASLNWLRINPSSGDSIKLFIDITSIKRTNEYVYYLSKIDIESRKDSMVCWIKSDCKNNKNVLLECKDFNKNKNFMMEDDEETLAMKRKKGKFIKPEAKPVVEEEVIKVITLDDTVTIKELAEKMKIQPAAIVKKLFLQGQIVTVNQEITFEEAENIAIDYDIIWIFGFFTYYYFFNLFLCSQSPP